MVVPPEATDWARENGIPLPPTEYDSTFGPSEGGGNVAIQSPQPYGYVSGVVEIQGTARAEPADQFQLYRVELGEGLDPASWIQIGPDHTEQVSNNTLEYLDTSDLQEGLYTLQLTVLHNDGTAQRSSIQITVDKTAPQVQIAYPYPDQEYVLGGDEWVNIQADAEDNFAMQRVDFFIDGNQFESSTVAPFNKKWTLSNEAGLAPGQTREHEIRVIAVDAAGNQTESEAIRIRVRARQEEE